MPKWTFSFPVDVRVLVEVRRVGDSGDFRGHGLVFRIDDETLVRGVGTGGGLFGQFLHADQLFIDDAEGAVSGLDQRDGVVGVTHALVQGGDVRTHQFANGQAGCVVGGGADTKARRQPAYGRGR